MWLDPSASFFLGAPAVTQNGSKDAENKQKGNLSSRSRQLRVYRAFIVARGSAARASGGLERSGKGEAGRGRHAAAAPANGGGSRDAHPARALVYK